MKERILKYICDKYNPEALITYGSYADGSSNENSDFDALIIADGKTGHDGSTVDGVLLDVFIYSPDTFSKDYNPEEFVQIHDGKIEFDKNGTAARLKESVLAYIESIPLSSTEEVLQNTQWCRKMLMRAQRGDAEGFFRWHWLLNDSLEIYFGTVRKRYYGPKKALRQMAATDKESFDLYEAALKNFNLDALTRWIEHLEKLAANLE